MVSQFTLLVTLLATQVGIENVIVEPAAVCRELTSPLAAGQRGVQSCFPHMFRASWHFRVFSLCLENVNWSHSGHWRSKIGSVTDEDVNWCWGHFWGQLVTKTGDKSAAARAIDRSTCRGAKFNSLKGTSAGKNNEQFILLNNYSKFYQFDQIM